MVKKIKEEPVAFAALVEALLILLLSFGVDITKDQFAAIIGFVNIGGAFLARRNVFPVYSDEDAILDDDLVDE